MGAGVGPLPRTSSWTTSSVSRATATPVTKRSCSPHAALWPSWCPPGVVRSGHAAARRRRGDAPPPRSPRSGGRAGAERVGWGSAVLRPPPRRRELTPASFAVCPSLHRSASGRAESRKPGTTRPRDDPDPEAMSAWRAVSCSSCRTTSRGSTFITSRRCEGFSSAISDRMDLTLECIRRHYIGEWSPLTKVLERYSDFFALFRDFAGYVDFWYCTISSTGTRSGSSCASTTSHQWPCRGTSTRTSSSAARRSSSFARNARIDALGL